MHLLAICCVVQQEQMFFNFSRMSEKNANGANGENAQVGASNVDVPPAPPLNPDTIMASAEGGMFLL